MVKVHYVESANADNSAVTAGNPYYWWKLDGVKYYSATEPTESQLASDSFITSLISWSGTMLTAVFTSYAQATSFIATKRVELTVIQDVLQLEIDDIKQWEDFVLGVRLAEKMFAIERMITALEDDVDFTELQYAEINHNNNPSDQGLLAIYNAELQNAMDIVREIPKLYFLPMLPVPRT